MIVLSARKILVFIIVSVYCLAIGFVKASILDTLFLSYLQEACQKNVLLILKIRMSDYFRKITNRVYF